MALSWLSHRRVGLRNRVWVCRRCADLEERERELLRNQGSLQEALVQVRAAHPRRDCSI